MKRPMAVLGITFFAAQIFAAIVGATVSAVVSAVVLCLILLVLFDSEHRRKILPVLISCFIALGSYACYTFFVVDRSQMLEGHTTYVKGIIVDAPYESNERFYYIIKTDYIELDNSPQKIRIRVSSKTPIDAEMTDIFAGSVTFNQQNPDEPFSVRNSRLARGITATAYLEYGNVPNIYEGEHGAAYLINEFRNKIILRTELLFNAEYSALLRGFLLGDKSGISTARISDFRACGLSHLLAVSGLHMSIIVYALTFLLRQMGFRHRADAGILFCILWIYIMLTGFSYSVIRAGIMTSFVLLARVFKREADSLNSLGFALLAICIANPYSATDAGLLLSVSSTIGLILLHNPIFRKICSITGITAKSRYSWVNGIISALLTSIIASISTLPVIALYFGECSIISPLANLVCVPLANVFMVSGAAAVIISFIPIIGTVLAKIIFFPAWFSAKIMTAVIGALADLPHARININYDFMPTFLICVFVIGILWYLLFGKSKDRFKYFLICTAVIAVAFIFGVTIEEVLHMNDHIVKVYSVDSGLSLVIKSEGSCVVIGTGGERYDVWNMTLDMQDNNLSVVDAVFYPSFDDEYASYAQDFIRDSQPKYIYVANDTSARDEIHFAVKNYKNENIKYVSESDLYVEKDNLKITSFDEGDGKIWIHAVVGDMKILICPEGGNASSVPEEMKNPSCAVTLSDDIINVTALNAASFVVSADRDDCAVAEATLLYRGVENVYTTYNGDVVITEHKAGIMIEG